MHPSPDELTAYFPSTTTPNFSHSIFPSYSTLSFHASSSLPSPSLCCPPPFSSFLTPSLLNPLPRPPPRHPSARHFSCSPSRPHVSSRNDSAPLRPYPTVPLLSAGNEMSPTMDDPTPAIIQVCPRAPSPFVLYLSFPYFFQGSFTFATFLPFPPSSSSIFFLLPIAFLLLKWSVFTFFLYTLVYFLLVSQSYTSCTFYPR